jgi:uncharacterized protein (DUF305 family)
MTFRPAILIAMATIMPASIALIQQPAFAQEAEAQKAFTDAHHKMLHMMEGMKPSGDADKDFVMMMIPHHQGAIDMAEVELKYGKDPMLRQMAEDIIESQKKEIEEMKKWQQEKGM